MLTNFKSKAYRFRNATIRASLHDNQAKPLESLTNLERRIEDPASPGCSRRCTSHSPAPRCPCRHPPQNHVSWRRPPRREQHDSLPSLVSACRDSGPACRLPRRRSGTVCACGPSPGENISTRRLRDEKPTAYSIAGGMPTAKFTIQPVSLCEIRSERRVAKLCSNSSRLLGPLSNYRSVLVQAPSMPRLPPAGTTSSRRHSAAPMRLSVFRTFVGTVQVYGEIHGFPYEIIGIKVRNREMFPRLLCRITPHLRFR